MCHVQNQGNIRYVHFKNVFVCMCAMDIFHFGLMCSVIMEHIRPGNHNSCFSVRCRMIVNREDGGLRLDSNSNDHTV